MRHTPVGENRPLVPLSIDGKDVGFEGFVSRQVEVLPGCNFVVDLDAQGLDGSSVNGDGDRGKRGFVPCLERLGTLANRVPNGGCAGCHLTVSDACPVVTGEHHRESVASDVNACGVDVHAVIGGDGGGRNRQLEVVDLTVANGDHQFIRSSGNGGQVEPPNADMVGEILLVNLRVVSVGGRPGEVACG